MEQRQETGGNGEATGSTITGQRSCYYSEKVYLIRRQTARV